MPAGPLSTGPSGKKARTFPKLSLDTATPPNSGTSDSFSFPPSPSTIVPTALIDANVAISKADLTQWKSEAGPELCKKVCGVVLSLNEENAQELVEKIEPVFFDVPILCLSVPFSVTNGVPSSIPSGSKIPITLSIVYKKQTPQGIEALKWALQQGHIVDIDVQFDNDETSFDTLEDTLTKATEDAKENSAIVLSNILPPADDVELPLVKLLNHPSYRAYQGHTASLSLFRNTYIKFIPPSWQATTPPTPAPLGGVRHEDSQEKKQWKRRIKMYIGPALEAFGDQRIIFGSSSSLSSHEKSTVWDWYELARESFTELGIGQEGIDAIFCDNAKQVYGSGQ